MKIHRLTLPVTDRQVVELPWPYRILSVAPARTGGEYVDLWFIDPNHAPGDATILGFDEQGAHVRAPVTGRVVVHIAGTGHVIPNDIDDDDFIGTCVMPSHLVWHVFARETSHAEEADGRDRGVAMLNVRSA